MKKLALVLVVLALFVAPAVASSLTIIAVPSTVPDGTPGELKLEFWADGFTSVAGLDVQPVFTLKGADVSSAFMLKPDPDNPDPVFVGPPDATHPDGLGYTVEQATLWPSVFGYVGLEPRTLIGFISFSSGKAIPTSKLIMAATYTYGELADGEYYISLHPDSIGLVNTTGPVPDVYQTINGTFTVGEVIPEPCTMALLGCGLVGLLGYGR
ncbi:MAG TPA: hypothetical protein VMX97_05155, partial [Hyphomicrobiaceae bacterium]|nr:hypothetical protein [Hyphomicrobiaceae bacterium]